MSFETALRARLKSAQALSGKSIEWARRPEGRYPVIVLTIVSLPLGQHMAGFNPWQRPRVQFDVMALDAESKVALREAVLVTIAPAALFQSVRFNRAIEVSIADLSEQTDTDFIHRDMIEAVIPFMLES